MADADTCFQCGARPVTHVPPEHAAGADDWMTCDRCGERTITIREFRALVEKAQEDRIKDVLGFRDFRPGDR